MEEALRKALEERDLQCQYHEEAHKEISALYVRLEAKDKIMATQTGVIKELKAKLYDLLFPTN